MTHFMKNFYAAGLLALAIAPSTGCIAASPKTMPGPSSTEACSTEQLTDLIGQPASEANIAKASQVSGARSVRVIKVGAMVTMDFRTDRLNIELSKDGRIARLRCG
ncbi:I78 family peptidase inhibitor [Oryzibacter oryziterrae]|uniref:I78 family peptidase inhibitor n=1 Tax=Oryzibacter oryziterrae TaxID=2766474 RepID=UPI001EEF25AB|nr:I78 family peptidase inhibitor [Oryzibacter oryziterrae]